MGAFTHIETDTGTNVDISAATAVGAYTSTGDKLIMVDVSIDAVAGNGDYVMYVTRQIGGSGSAYRILPQTTMTAASGLTAISAQSGWITVRNGDVLTCYVDGLAGDTSTPDWSTRWFELAAVAAPDNTGIAAIQAKTDQLTFTTPNKVDATATVDTTGIATSAALAVVDANVDAIKAKTDALDVSSVTVVSSVEGSTLTVLRGDTWDDAHLLNLCDLTDYVSIDFLVKESKADTDDDAIIHIRKNVSGVSDGLLRLNKAAHTTGTDGAITIEDIPTGDITPTLKAAVTKDLAQGNYVYDVQVITATSVKTRTSGKLVVTADVTRLVA
jgi:hypothetical protein